MKKAVLIALTILGAGVVASKADVSFGISIGDRHRDLRHYRPAPVVVAPAPVVVAPDCAPVPVGVQPPVVYERPRYGYGHRDYGYHHDRQRVYGEAPYRGYSAGPGYGGMGGGCNR